MLAHKRFGICVLVLEIFYYRRIFLLIPIAQPGVVVHYFVAVDLQDLRLFFCNRWFHSFLGNYHGVADYNNDKNCGNAQQRLHMLMLLIFAEGVLKFNK